MRKLFADHVRALLLAKRIVLDRWLPWFCVALYNLAEGIQHVLIPALPGNFRNLKIIETSKYYWQINLALFMVASYTTLYEISRGIADKKIVSPETKLDLRQKWRREFDGKLELDQQSGTFEECTILDIERDTYPGSNSHFPGWFRIGIGGISEGKYLQVVSWVGQSVLEDNGRWRLAEYSEVGAENGVRVCYIPLEWIERVEWENDGYYDGPRIYCHFNGKDKWPYARVTICRYFKASDGRIHYEQIVDADEAFRNAHPWLIRFSVRLKWWWARR